MSIIDQQPASVRLLDCPAWCRGDHDPNDPGDRAHYSTRPKQIDVSAVQPDPLTPFRSIAVCRSLDGDLEQVGLVVDRMYDLAILTPAEARRVRDQLSAALDDLVPDSITGRDLYAAGHALFNAAHDAGVFPEHDGEQPADVFLKKRSIGEPIHLFTAPGKVPFSGTQDGRIGATRQEALAWMTGATSAYQQLDQTRSTP